jgi:hypothetical protein
METSKALQDSCLCPKGDGIQAVCCAAVRVVKTSGAVEIKTNGGVSEPGWAAKMKEPPSQPESIPNLGNMG